MNFTPEQLAKAKAAKSAEELLALAKENGVELTEEEAKKYFAEWHKEGELSDNELDNVSGGCGDDVPDPKYNIGESVWVNYNEMGWGTITERAYTERGWRYTVRIECVTFGGRKDTYVMNLTEENLGF